MTIYTIETNSELQHDPHTVGYYVGANGLVMAQTDIERVTPTWPNAAIAEYPANIMLLNGCGG
jgi:hypothetical protein